MWNLWGRKEGVTTKGTKYAKPLHLHGFVCFANFVVKPECILMWNLWGRKEGVTTKGTK